MSTLQRFEFEGQPLPVFTFHERPCMIVGDVGRVLGYGDDGKLLVTSMRKLWGDELVRGTDFDTLEGEALAAFKALAGETPVSPNTRSLTILYESGLHLVCLKTEKPLGKKLRRFLADEVMPKLMRREPITPAPQLPTDPPPWAREILTRLAALEGAAASHDHDGQIGPARAAVLRRQLIVFGQLMGHGDPRAAKSWRTMGDNELRERLGHPRSKGRPWSRLPVGRYGEALSALEAMLARARKVDVAHLEASQLPLKAS